jgi:hypothetical protein
VLANDIIENLKAGIESFKMGSFTKTLQGGFIEKRAFFDFGVYKNNASRV